MFFKKKRIYHGIEDAKQGILYSPAKGTVIDLKDVNDTVFSSGMLGSGIGVRPLSDDITSPMEGKIVSVFPTKHALGILGRNGEEIIIHIGIETVSLNGRYFTINIKAGQQVKAGELLANVNFQKLTAEGYDTTVLMVISNSQSFDTKRLDASEYIEIGQPLLEIIKKDG